MLPKYNEMAFLILQFAVDKTDFTIREAYVFIADHFKLSEEDLFLTTKKG